MRIELNVVKDATSYEIDKLMTELVHNKLVESARIIHHTTVLSVPDRDRTMPVVSERLEVET